MIEQTPIGPQHIIPGAEHDPASMAQRKADAALKPAKPQQPCDVGLFSDDAKQLELLR